MGLDNPIHLALLLLIMLLVFGAKRLPEMGRSLGDGLRGFKEAVGGTTPAAQIDHVATQSVVPTQSAVAPAQSVVPSPSVVAEPESTPVA